MNIIQQQEALKDLSDSQIAQQMQQPSGDMPLYLVSSEAKRRADLRMRFKAEQAGPPPTTTVQEDLLRSVMNAQTPPSGIAQGIGMPQQGPQGPQGPQMPPQQAGIMSGALQQPPAPQARQMPQQFAQGGIVQYTPPAHPNHPYAGVTYGSPEWAAIASRLRGRHAAELSIQNGEYETMETEQPAPGSSLYDRVMATLDARDASQRIGRGSGETMATEPPSPYSSPYNPPIAAGQADRNLYLNDYGTMETEQPAVGYNPPQTSGGGLGAFLSRRMREFPAELGESFFPYGGAAPGTMGTGSPDLGEFGGTPITPPPAAMEDMPPPTGSPAAMEDMPPPAGGPASAPAGSPNVVAPPPPSPMEQAVAPAERDVRGR
jgi:hypothetical protein